jgi:hypothetical protein
MSGMGQWLQKSKGARLPVRAPFNLYVTDELASLTIRVKKPTKKYKGSRKKR